MDSGRARIAVSVADATPKVVSSKNLCRPLASLTRCVAKHQGALQGRTKAFEFLRDLGCAMEVEVSITSQAIDTDRDSVVSTASTNNSDVCRWGDRIAALNNSTAESERKALFLEVRGGLKGCTVNEALGRLKEVEHIAESLQKELRKRQQVHKEAIDELKENFAERESQLHARAEKAKNGFPPNVVFSHDLNVLLPDIQQMLGHGGVLCAFGHTGHVAAGRLALLLSRHMQPLFDPASGDGEDKVTVAALEITPDGNAVNLLGKRGKLRAFHQEHYGVTFPDLVAVTVKSPEEVTKLVESQAICPVDPLSTIIWMVKRGDCCYGPERIVVVGLPSHAAPDDVTPQKVSLLLQEGQQATFFCCDEVKTLSPTYERMAARVQHRWRCKKGTTRKDNVQKTAPPAVSHVQRTIARLRNPCHLSYGEVYAKLRATPDPTVTFDEESPHNQAALNAESGEANGQGAELGILQGKLDAVMSSQNEILRSLNTSTPNVDDPPNGSPLLYNELKQKLASMEKLVQEKDLQLKNMFQGKRPGMPSVRSSAHSSTPQLFLRNIYSPASCSSTFVPVTRQISRPETARPATAHSNISQGFREPIIRHRTYDGPFSARGRSHDIDPRAFPRNSSFIQQSPPMITRILGTPVIVEHREPRSLSNDPRTLLAGSMHALNMTALNGAARVTAAGNVARAGFASNNGGFVNNAIARPGPSTSTLPVRQISNASRVPAPVGALSPNFSPGGSPCGLSPVPPTPRSCVLREVGGAPFDKHYSPRLAKRK